MPPEIETLAVNLLPAGSSALDDRRDDGQRVAAVLALLYPGEQGAQLVLTLRPATLRSHADQISLPGGRWEPGDTDLWHTARREAQEEVGVSPETLRLLGELEPVQVTVSGFHIVPFVAWTDDPPVFTVDPIEVAEIIEVPLAWLTSPDHVEEETWELHGAPYRVTYFRFGQHQVWGATARVLHLLGRRLGSAVHSSGFPPGSVRPA